jgi:hypothetical protein
LESQKQFRLVLLYLLWFATVIAALIFARAYHLESYNVGWGDLAAGNGHAVLWWETIALMIASFLLAIFIGLLSRVALYSISAAGALAWLLTFLGSQGPHAYRIILFIPQLPGFFAAITALGIHGDEHLTTWWVVGVNTIMYAPIFHTVLVRRTRQRSSPTESGE